MSRFNFAIPGVLFQRPLRGRVMTVYTRDPGPAFTVVKLGARRLVRAAFTQGANAIAILSGFPEPAAHDVAEGIWGYCALELGTVPEADEPLFYRLPRLPRSGWTNAQLLEDLKLGLPDANEAAVRRMKSGVVLGDFEQHYLRETLPKIVGDQHLRESLNYFVESARNCQTFMSISFYQFHYRRERSLMSAAQLRRDYRQNRARYEAAFTVGFKALERLLRRVQIRKPDIPAALGELNVSGLEPGATYTRLFEPFQGHATQISCRDLIVRFLDIRNAAGAHANSNPPVELRVSLDTVFELQHFLRWIYRLYLQPVMPFEPPMYDRTRRDR